MDLKVKYSRLISFAQQSNVKDLSITEKSNVLHISGTTTNDVKDKLWEIYNQIDPDMRSGDLILNLNIDETVNSAYDGKGETYEVKAGDNLSKIAQNYSNMTWQKIYDANRDVLSDPNKIYAGQKLRIPIQE